jgi:gamma-glutamyltranspeptidase / glutathione hydrolase
VRFDDYLHQRNPLSRSSMLGRRGAVATSQPLATQAGMSVLHAGGNAIDAAIATAAALTVVEPTSNGLGGDAFALIWADGELHGLNASGRAPALATLERYAGHTDVPKLGWLAVTVPGAVSSWTTLHERFGRLPFDQVLAPAIALAEGGFAVSPTVARYWGMANKMYRKDGTGPEFAGWFQTFAPSGSSPQTGDIVQLNDHAATLRAISSTKGKAFYEGHLAETIDTFAKQTGGLLRGEDLAAHRADWVDPISTNYRGYDIWEIPPNGHGITALNALNILEGFDIGSWAADDPYSWHVQIESLKLAYADAFTYVADPTYADVPVKGLLDKTYAAQRRALITDEASLPVAGEPPRGGTVLLCTADGDGNMVSFIQSNYADFGSGVVIPGTGIAMQNRGANFSLDPSHRNVIAPGKRPYHTIIPGFMTHDGAAVGPFGVMGGFMQPQGHLQLIVRTVDQFLHPQAALDAPRWRWEAGRTVWIEPRTSSAIVDDLRARGHEVQLVAEPSAYGRGQIIWRDGDTLIAGSESRADGQASVW